MVNTSGWGRKVLVWLLIATAITPFFYFKGMFYPFTASKAFLFRTLIELSGALFLLLFVLEKLEIRIDLLHKKISLLPALFLFAGFVSAVFGLSFLYSFWSSATRMDGLLTLLHLVAYFYILLAVFEKKDWQKFMYAIAGVSVLVAFSGVMERWGLWDLGPEDGRVGGTINNAAFLASYLVFTAPLLIYSALRNRKSVKLFSGFIIAAIFSLFAILVTGTRGALVGLVVAAGVLLVMLARNARGKVKKRAAVALVVIMLFILGGFVFRDALKQSDILIVRRIASISLSDATTQSRLYVWQNTFPYVMERPILGFGMENFEYVYNKFYDPSVLTEEWFDRSHNTYLDALIHGGVVGLIFYAAMYGAMAYLIWGLRKKDEQAFYTFSFLFVAYAVQNFFVFDSLNTQFLFYSFLAYLVYRETEDEVPKYLSFAQLESKKWAMPMQVGGFILAVLCAGSAYWFVWQPLRANLLLVEGYKYQIVKPDESLATWRKGLLSGSSHDMDYGYQAYDSYFNKATEGVSGADLKKAYDYGAGLLKDLIKRDPWNARYYVYLAHMHEGRPGGAVLTEEEFKGVIDKAMELSPKRKQSYYILANLYFSRTTHSPYIPSEATDFEKGISTIREYAQMVPTFAEPHILIANLLLQNSRKAEAAEEFAKGITLYKPEASLARRVITYYLVLEDYKNVEPYLEYAVHEDSTNMDFLFDLAHVYYLNGKEDEARKAIEAIAKTNRAILDKDPAFVRTLFPQGVTPS